MLKLFIPIWDTKTISISFWLDSLPPFIMWTLFIMFTGARQWVRHAIAAARQRHPCAYHPCLTTLSIPLSLNDMSQCIILLTSTSYICNFLHVYEDHQQCRFVVFMFFNRKHIFLERCLNDFVRTNTKIRFIEWTLCCANFNLKRHIKVLIRLMK